jgi:hypothetical protein
MGKKAWKKRVRQEARARRQGHSERLESMYTTGGINRPKTTDRLAELNELWPTIRQKYEDRTAAKLTFDYVGNPALREAVIRSLALWRFYHEEVRDEKSETVTAFFKPFLSECRQMAVVAMLEQLPTSVWRRILWRENIDYVTPESFLRRLTIEQFIAIRENFLDLSERHTVPRAFTRWEVRRYKLTPENPFPPTYCRQTEGHGASKGSWSYNLLKLDFGFNQYPKGEANDYKLVEVSPMRFLSEKNHADDFAVNDEFGKYWWFYQKARSNSVWKPERQVELNDYICPGFWYTLIIHAIFWLISPLCASAYASTLFAGFNPLIYQGFKTVLWWAGTPLALFMPIWCIIAVIRRIAEGAGIWEYVQAGLVIMAMIVVAAVFGVFFVKVLYPICEWFFGQLGYLHLLFIAALLFTAPAYQLVRRIREHRRPPTIGKKPALLIITSSLAFASAIIHLVYNNRAVVWEALLVVGELLMRLMLKIGAILAFTVNKVFGVILAVGWLWLLFLPGAVMITLTWYLERLPEEKQKKLDRLIDRYSQLAAKGILLFSLGFFLIWAFNIHSSGAAAETIKRYLWPMVAITGSLIYYTLIYWLSRRKSPVEKRLKESAWQITHRHSRYEVDYADLRDNDWLRNLPPDELSATAKAFEQFVEKAIYSSHECRQRAFRDLVRHAKPETLPYLNNYTANLEQLISKEAYEVLGIMLRQPALTFDQALSELVRRKERNEKIVTFLKKVFFIPIKLFQALRFVFIEVPVTVKRIWERFNKYCPVRFKSQRLSFD